MRYALINNERKTPSPGLKAQCQICGSTLIARCGPQRIWHWAHHGERHCDAWWEPETAWHHAWKNNFPANWQEQPRYDFSGEKHVADVLTPHGLTIEFQHSHLRPEERVARESFYGNMVWIVDGARLKRDFPRFLNGGRGIRQVVAKGIFVTGNPETMFPADWLGCTTPIFFDFQDATASDVDSQHVRDHLWCLLPGNVFGLTIIVKLSRMVFVRAAKDRAQPINVGAIRQAVARPFLVARARRANLMRIASVLDMMNTQRSRVGPRRQRRF